MYALQKAHSPHPQTNDLHAKPLRMMMTIRSGALTKSTCECMRHFISLLYHERDTAN